MLIPTFFLVHLGLGLTYQGGLTFYNTGAAAPGTPIATPTDSTTIYQTAGIFGELMFIKRTKITISGFFI